LVVRTVHPTIPPRVEYALTPIGAHPDATVDSAASHRIRLRSLSGGAVPASTRTPPWRCPGEGDGWRSGGASTAERYGWRVSLLRLAPGPYAPGVILGVPVMTDSVGVVVHKGIQGDSTGWDGLPTVVHCSKLYRTALETTMTEFAFRATGPVRSEGHPGRLPAWRVLQNARSKVGVPWRLEQNCKHFTTWAHGLVPTSPSASGRGREGCRGSVARSHPIPLARHPRRGGSGIPPTNLGQMLERRHSAERRLRSERYPSWQVFQLDRCADGFAARPERGARCVVEIRASRPPSGRVRGTNRGTT
jgi:hypothetical protein